MLCFFSCCFLSSRPPQAMRTILEISVAGRKCLWVSGKVVLWSTHFYIRILVPMLYLKLYDHIFIYIYIRNRLVDKRREGVNISSIGPVSPGGPKRENSVMTTNAVTDGRRTRTLVKIVASLALAGGAAVLAMDGMTSPTPLETNVETLSQTSSSVATSSPSSTASTASSLPHIVFLLLDDVGYNDMLDQVSHRFYALLRRHTHTNLHSTTQPPNHTHSHTNAHSRPTWRPPLHS